MDWKGYYIHRGQKDEMSLGTTRFQPVPGAAINGWGKDEVGSFKFEGSFSPNALICRFVKQYDGQHSVYYQGTYDKSSKSISGHFGFKAGANDGEFKMHHY